MKITIFNEYHEDQKKGKAKKYYPHGLHDTIKKYLKQNSDWDIAITIQEQPSNGLNENLLNDTDVLVWWSDKWNSQILTDVSKKVVERVQQGMGLVVLYGGCSSKPFKELMGTSCSHETSSYKTTVKMFALDPTHQLCEGVDFPIEFSDSKTFGEPFDVPKPKTTPVILWSSNESILRSLLMYKSGEGKIVYYYGGSAHSNAYLLSDNLKIIFNAIKWVEPVPKVDIEQPIKPLKEPEKKKFSLFKRK